MKISILAAVAVLLTSISVAHAGGDKHGHKTGPYLSAGPVQAFIVGGCNSPGPAVVYTACDRRALGLKLYGGYNFNRHHALELGYTTVNGFSWSGTVTGERFTSEVDVDIAHLAGVYKAPINHRAAMRFSGGFYHWNQDETTVINGNRRVTSFHDTDPLAAIGYEYRFGANTTWRIEWTRFFDSSDNDMDTIASDFVWSF